ncbi:hypothetical protein DB346_01320 [Verrucomicrobia bacterium LW23]|nr:hypothetical protein DB346_01320 [Verrucomicrobia bacterium LW23]
MIFRSPHFHLQRRTIFCRGFTLVELITAMAVLAVLGLIIAQLTTATVQISDLSNRAINATGQARLVLDRIGADLATTVRRRDVDFVARNPAVGEPDVEKRNALWFVASTPAADLPPADNRGISVVAYQVAPHPNNANRLCLVRAGLSVPWNRPAAWSDTDFMGIKADGLPVRLSSADTSFPRDLVPAAPNFDVLAPGVIRMVVGFQLYPDNLPVDLADGTHFDNAQGQIVYSPPIRSGTGAVAYVDTDRISSIVVGVVALDLESLRLLNAAQVMALAQHFGGVPMNSVPVAAWRAASDNAVLSGVPPRAAQSVRVFQRFYPMTPNGSKRL